MADPAEVRALTFDCYGTLIDWETGIRAYLRALLERKGAAHLDVEVFYDRWYNQCERKIIDGPFLVYHDVLHQSIQCALAAFDLHPQPEDGADFGLAMKTWQPFADTHQVLTRLARKYPLCIVSNTARDIVAESIRHMDVSFAQVVTAQDSGAYKPNRPSFEMALARLGLPPGQVLHVFQSKVADLVTASPMGFQTAWINRQHETLEPELPRPDWTFTELGPLLDLLGA